MRAEQKEPLEERTDGQRRICAVCGQAFDTTDMDQVFHHDSAPHQPLESSSES